MYFVGQSLNWCAMKFSAATIVLSGLRTESRNTQHATNEQSDLLNLFVLRNSIMTSVGWDKDLRKVLLLWILLRMKILSERLDGIATWCLSCLAKNILPRYVLKSRSMNWCQLNCLWRTRRFSDYDQASFEVKNSNILSAPRQPWR